MVHHPPLPPASRAVRIARGPVFGVLRPLARLVVRRRRPVVVGITGTVGKTTTKELVAEVLATRFRVWSTPGSHNLENGVAFAVLGVRVTGRPMRDWPLAFLRAGLLLAFRRRRYPEVLVLEMGGARPGDLRRLTREYPPDVAVVTTVGANHLEFFVDVDHVEREKTWLVRRLRPGGLAVLNADDHRVAAMAALTPERVMTVGRSKDADVRLENITSGPEGIAARVRLNGDAPAIRSPLLGAPRMVAVAQALTVAVHLGVPLDDAVTVLGRQHGPAGRLRLVPGRHGATILDDSYSASPPATRLAFETLRSCPGPRRAVFGELEEPGAGQAAEHRAIGAGAAPWLDALVAVGRGGELVAQAAIAHGMDPARVEWVPDQASAAALAREFTDGTLLVKGSSQQDLDRLCLVLVPDPKDPAVLDRNRPPRSPRRS